MVCSKDQHAHITDLRTGSRFLHCLLVLKNLVGIACTEIMSVYHYFHYLNLAGKVC